MATMMLVACNGTEGMIVSRKVGMLGLDYADGKYTACIQLTKVGINSFDKDKSFDCYQGKSTTVLGALESAQLKSGVKLNWNNLNAVAIGESAAIKGIKEIIDTLEQNSQIRSKTPVAIVTPTASNLIMGEDKKSGIESTTVELGLTKSAQEYSAPHSTILSLAKSMENTGSGGLVSLINIDASHQQTDVTGSAVIYEGMMVAVLNKELTQTVLWLGDKPELLSMEMLMDRVSVIRSIIKQSKIKLKPMVSDGKLVFIAQLYLDDSLAGKTINHNSSDELFNITNIS